MLWEALSHSSHCPYIVHILQHNLLHQYKIYHALYLHSILAPCHPCVLLQTPMLKYVLPTHSPLSKQNFITLLPLSFSPGTPKAPLMPSLVLSSIHPFRSHRMHNLYPFTTLSKILSMLFQNLSLSSPSPSLGPYLATTQTLTLENLNLIQRILELTYPKSITPLYYTSFNRMATPSLGHSISWILAMMPFTAQHDTSPFHFNFISIKASNLNFPSLKMQSHLFLLHSMYLNGLHSFAELYWAGVGNINCSVWGQMMRS